MADNSQSLEHFVLYGQKGEQQVQRAEAGDWDKNEFSKPESAPWNVTIPQNHISKVLNGFIPGEMEDKWFVYTDVPDAQGNTAVHFHRSWTGLKVVELKIKVPVGEEGADALVTEISWETDTENLKGASEEFAKETAKEVCNWVLRVELKELV